MRKPAIRNTDLGQYEWKWFHGPADDYSIQFRKKAILDSVDINLLLGNREKFTRPGTIPVPNRTDGQRVSRI